jgi:hypothetical protein
MRYADDPRVRGRTGRRWVARIAAALAVAGALSPMPAGADTTSSVGARPSHLTCPSASQCTATINGEAETTFDPNSALSQPPATITGAVAHSVIGVACPLLTQCTAVGHQGSVVTFDPTSPATRTPAKLATNELLGAVACPSPSQCTAVGDFGTQATFDPVAPAAATLTKLATFTDGYMRSVACPSTHQCTAVYDGGGQVTFDPAAAGAATATTVAVGVPQMNDIDCPSVHQCTAVTLSSRGDEQVTFDPIAPGTATQSVITTRNELRGVACPSTHQCTAVGSDFQVTFDPTVPGSEVQTLIGVRPVFVDVACPSTMQCTALDFSNGVQVTFTPPNPKPVYGLTVMLAGSGHGSVTGGGIACPPTCSARVPDGTTVVLTAVAQAGSAFAGFTGERCAGAPACPITVTGDRTVTAAFTTGSTIPAPVPKPCCAPPSPAPKPISAAQAFKLPSATACVSRRSFTIRIRRLAGITWVRAVVIVNGKRVKTVKRSRITAAVNLTGLPKGRFTVSITATATDGRTVTGQRRYHTCAAKRRGSHPPI